MNNKDDFFPIHLLIFSLVIFFISLFISGAFKESKFLINISKIFAINSEFSQPPSSLKIFEITNPKKDDFWQEDNSYFLTWHLDEDQVKLLKDFNESADAPYRYGSKTYFFDSVTLLIGGVDLLYNGQKICSAIMNPFGNFDFKIPYRLDNLDITSGKMKIEVLPAGEQKVVLTSLWSTNPLGNLSVGDHRFEFQPCEAVKGERYQFSLWTGKINVANKDLSSLSEQDSPLVFEKNITISNIFEIK